MTNNERIIFSMSMAIVIVLSSLSGSAAQTTTADEVATRQAIAEADLKDYELRLKKAELDAKLFETSQKQIESLRGSPTAETLTIENEISAYGSMNCLASQVWTRLDTNQISSLVIFDPAIAGTVAEYRLTLKQIERLSGDYDKSIEVITGGKKKSDTNKMFSAAFLPQLPLTIATDILSLFKTGITLKGSSVSPAKDSFVASFLDRRPSTHSGVSVYYPEKMIPIDVGGSTIVKKLSDLQAAHESTKAFKHLYELETKLRARKDLATKIGTSNDIEELAKLKEQFAKTEKEIAKLKEDNHVPLSDEIVLKEIGALKRVDAAVESLETKLGVSSTPAVVGQKTLVDFLRAEMVNDKFVENESKTFWFDISMIKAGGTVRTKKSVITGVFRPSGQITFSGGTVLSYSVIDKYGQIRWSGTTSHYNPFEKANRLTSGRCDPSQIPIRNL